MNTRHDFTEYLHNMIQFTKESIEINQSKGHETMFWNGSLSALEVVLKAWEGFFVSNEKGEKMTTQYPIMKMTDHAVENYGECWRGVMFEITHKATKYMPANEFFANGRPQGYHPGYGEAAGCALYDLKRVDTGEDLPFSLYSWELARC